MHVTVLLLALKDAVVGRLADSKPEVRAIAMATLAGMIKGMSNAEAEALRAEVLAKARSLLSPARAAVGLKRTAAAESSSSTAAGGSADAGALLLQKHSAVLVSGDVVLPIKGSASSPTNLLSGHSALLHTPHPTLFLYLRPFIIRASKHSLSPPLTTAPPGCRRCSWLWSQLQQPAVANRQRCGPRPHLH